MTPPPKTQQSLNQVDASAASQGHSLQLPPEQIQAIARALAEPRRFAILQQIAGSESLLCGRLDVQECITPATISHHLKELQESGLIDVERSGRQARLSMRRSVWDAYVRTLQQL